GGQAWVCMLSTGKSVHPNGGPPVVSPGCSLDAELITSGPLQVPYQTAGYTSAWRANEFFFHSSQAISPSADASAQMRVALSEGHTPPSIDVPGCIFITPWPTISGLLLSWLAPIGEGRRSS